MNEKPRDPPANRPAAAPAVGKPNSSQPREIGGPKGPEPTRYGDWEHNGRCTDFWFDDSPGRLGARTHPASTRGVRHRNLLPIPIGHRRSSSLRTRWRRRRQNQAAAHSGATWRPGL